MNHPAFGTPPKEGNFAGILILKRHFLPRICRFLFYLRNLALEYKFLEMAYL